MLTRSPSGPKGASSSRTRVVSSAPSQRLSASNVWARASAWMRPLTAAMNSSVLAACVSWTRSEEHTSELQSLMRISYAVFCLKKKTREKQTDDDTPIRNCDHTHSDTNQTQN